jgi:uncharacterized protein YndB with AHSA1/START domain
MARATASIVIKAPADRVWAVLRDFDGLAGWHPAVMASSMENGADPDVVGAVRSLRLADLTHVQDRLTGLDDARRRLSYRSEKPGFPVTDLTGEIAVRPVTEGGGSFVSWDAAFEPKPGEHADVWENVFGNALFPVGLKALRRQLEDQAGAAEDHGAPGGTSGHKVWTSRVLAAPVDRVWAEMRDFSAMARWHPALTDMAMENGARPDKVSAVRAFRFRDSPVRQQLVALDDARRSFSYRILDAQMPLRNYRSRVRLWPVTETRQTFAVWTGDWEATPEDDRTLVPLFERDVYQTGLATLEAKLVEASAAETEPEAT